jgi:hypothetical protein
MTSQGSAYARFKRSLANGNPTIVLAAAAELPQVGLADALAISLLLLDKQPGRFEAAAIRWHARLCREAKLAFRGERGARGTDGHDRAQPRRWRTSRPGRLRCARIEGRSSGARHLAQTMI